MALIPVLKSAIPRLPESIGLVAARVPFGWRPGLGTAYRRRHREIAAYDRMTSDQKRAFILQGVRRIVRHAINEVPFYRDWYGDHGFSIDRLTSFEDIANIPVVNKAALRACDLERRSYLARGRYPENTGGSSGSTLQFYIQPGAIPREWAHMHVIWSKLGYRPSDLKLWFGGRHLGDAAVCYDAMRNHYAVSVYRPYAEIAAALKRITAKRRVKYLHGYPSALYDFACYCDDHEPRLKDRLTESLVGAFLGSEYPNPHYRDKIESVFQIDTVSWYGHTERAVLAWERNEKFVYEPFQTYGYAEAVTDPSTGKLKLVVTSYGNLASPFIRYDTGDIISAQASEQGVLKAFRISEGREGDYVLDRQNRRIPLTGLIFGRHHEIFETANFVQIAQSEPGKATIYVTLRQPLAPAQCAARFDARGVDIEFHFEVVDQPIKSPAGKVLLRIPATRPAP